ncbi:hypothetical protein EJ08DRAFT_693725 [Tothia fuscella]|uniref:Uncharacterized protein n=1 Tax=Tothia fuscella TaxID=1048955 RepID=A0A9P4NZN0_9PEZI|nr:hypothetical protein EJ08DRAFT_693725 [Tothia fuscella]
MAPPYPTLLVVLEDDAAALLDILVAKPHQPLTESHLSPKQQATKVSFLDLPRELRDHIYTDVLLPTRKADPYDFRFCLGEEIITSEHCIFGPQSRPTNNTRTTLLRLCRQIHYEGAKILY